MTPARTAPTSAVPAPTPEPIPAPHGMARKGWIIGLVLLLLLSLGGIVWFAGVLIRANQDVAAMIVPTVAPTEAGISTVVIPSSVAVPAPSPDQHDQSDQHDQTMAHLSPLTAPDASAPYPSPAPAAPVPAAPVPAPDDQEPTPWPTIQSLKPVGGDGSVPTAPPRMLPPAGSTDAMTLLLLGNDRRPGEGGIPRTDAILLVRAEPEKNRIALLSLPRDLWVNVPGYGGTRINAAYVWGETYQTPGGGMNLARETVSSLLNMPVDYVMMVDFQGFIGLIDAIGGVSVNVEKELYDPSFPTMDYGYTVAHFLPGMQHMDGETALTYSRTRHPDSDFMRNLRQQAVLEAIARRLHERGDLHNLATIDQITAALRGYVQTTIPHERLIGLVWALRTVEPGQIEHYSITSDMVGWGVGSDAYALVAPPEVLTGLRNQFLALEPVQ